MILGSVLFRDQSKTAHAHRGMKFLESAFSNCQLLQFTFCIVIIFLVKYVIYIVEYQFTKTLDFEYDAHVETVQSFCNQFCQFSPLPWIQGKLPAWKRSDRMCHPAYPWHWRPTKFPSFYFFVFLYPVASGKIWAIQTCESKDWILWRVVLLNSSLGELKSRIRLQDKHYLLVACSWNILEDEQKLRGCLTTSAFLRGRRAGGNIMCQVS